MTTPLPLPEQLPFDESLQQELASEAFLQARAQQALQTIEQVEVNLGLMPEAGQSPLLSGFKLGVVKNKVLRWAATRFLGEEPQLCDNPREWWRTKIQDAHAHASERTESPSANTELWVVAAQHPLEEGAKPNNEFSARLDEMVTRYEAAAEEGRRVDIYVPGSRHVNDTVPGKDKPIDRLSLSDSAKRYLVQKGVPASVIYGEEWNLMKGGFGVYNGGDEMAVAAQVFASRSRFSSVHVILSPGQQERATLYAIANGILPEFIVPEGLQARSDLHHGDEAQAALMTAATYLIDPTWQAKRSPFGYLSRRMRTPKDGHGRGSMILAAAGV